MMDTKKSHMERNERKFARDMSKWRDFHLERLEGVDYALRLKKDAIEVEIQEQNAFEEAKNFRETKNFPPSPSPKSLPSKSIKAKPFSLPSKPINEAQELHEALNYNLNKAKYYNETVKLALQDKITPLQFVNNRRKEVSEADNKITDFDESSQQTEIFLARYSKPQLIGGENE